jgi:Flp pilus assembly pilin Flp
MRQTMLRLWKDDCGALIAVEWVFIATIMIIGLITGLVAVRQALLTELTGIADAVLSLNQSYSFSGQANCESETAGSSFQDNPAFSIEMHSLAADPGAINTAHPCD